MEGSTKDTFLTVDATNQEKLQCIAEGCRDEGCLFASIDAEFTGVEGSKCKWLDGGDERYLEKKSHAEKFSVVEIGVCLVWRDRTETYRILTKPATINVTWNMESYVFLKEHGVDVQRWWEHGIPHHDLRPILTTILQAKPVVGFALLQDLVYLTHHVLFPLPGDVDGFVRKFREEVQPRLVVDCRMVNTASASASHTPGLSKFYGKLLEDEKSPALFPVADEGGNWHQSGYDALMTARSFMLLLKKLRLLDMAKDEGVEATLKSQIREVVNRLPWHWAPDEFCLDLSEDVQYDPWARGYWNGFVVAEGCIEDVKAFKKFYNGDRIRSLSESAFLLEWEPDKRNRFFPNHHYRTGGFLSNPLSELIGLNVCSQQLAATIPDPSKLIISSPEAYHSQQGPHHGRPSKKRKHGDP